MQFIYFFSSALCAFYHHDWEITIKYITKPLPYIFSEDGFNSYMYTLKIHWVLFWIVVRWEQDSLFSLWESSFLSATYRKTDLSWMALALTRPEQGRCSVDKSLPIKYKKSRSISRNHIKKERKLRKWSYMFKIPELGRQRKEHPWISMARHLSLLEEAKASKRCFAEKMKCSEYTWLKGNNSTEKVKWVTDGRAK